METISLVSRSSPGATCIPKGSSLLSQIILLAEYALANVRQVIAPQRIFGDAIQTLVNHGGGEL